MAEGFFQERTEAPTQRRREEAREQGQVAFSADITQAALLTAGGGLLWWFTPTFASHLMRLMEVEILHSYRPSLDIAECTFLVRWLAGQLLTVLLPFMGVLAALALLSTALQVGLHVTWAPLSPDWSKLSPIKGWSKLFSLRALVRGGMLLLKLSIGLMASYWFLSAYQDTIVQIARLPLNSIIHETWRMGLMLMLALGGTLLAIGGIDYLYQWWQLEQSLMMTRQEIREEHKQMEGDPQIKGRIRRIQREMAKHYMLRRVKDATVVLTNPTHLAIALQYDRATMAAPKVIAKGKGLLAKRIARMAREKGIPVLERKPLARALYASVGVDQEIPPNLYRAIAEILAHIQRLGNRAA